MNGTFGDLSIVNTFINSSLHNNSLQILDGKDTNNTAEKYDPTPSVAFLATIFPLMVAGNICVLTLIFRKRGSKTRMDILFANTACADLSVAFFLVLSDLFWHQAEHWYAGNAMCKIVKYFALVATYSSNYAIVVLSLDRCNSVARPMQSFSRGLKGCRRYIGTSWGLSFLFSISSLVLFRVQNDKDGQPQCGNVEMNVIQWKIYFTLGAVLMLVIPAIIITICYTIIVVVVWKNSAFTPSDTDCKSNSNATTLIKDTTTLPNGRKTFSRAKIKSIKITFGIVIAFILSWSPYFIFNFLVVYHHIKIDSNRMYEISMMFQLLAPINSLANPMIFLIFNGKKYLQLCKNTDHVKFHTDTHTHTHTPGATV